MGVLRREVAISTSRLGPVLVLGLLVLPACGSSDSTPGGGPMPYGGSYGYGTSRDPANEQFKDDVQTNNTPKPALQELSFVNLKGETVPLKSYLGVKNLVLVVTRGQVGGTLCPYCSTQTSRLISNYSEITKRDAEVVVVFPVRWSSQAPQYDSFRKAAKEKINTDPSETPFPILLDLELNAVKSLDIQSDLAKPATYILDKKGQVRFAYVGEKLIDRPSMKAILKQLDELQDAKKN
jgi:peroxiredoxin